LFVSCSQQQENLGNCFDNQITALMLFVGISCGPLLAYGVHHFKCLLSMMACSSSPSSACCMQVDQQKSISAVQSALSHALQHVPLINGATTGGPGQVLLFCSL